MTFIPFITNDNLAIGSLINEAASKGNVAPVQTVPDDLMEPIPTIHFIIFEDVNKEAVANKVKQVYQAPAVAETTTSPSLLAPAPSNAVLLLPKNVKPEEILNRLDSVPSENVTFVVDNEPIADVEIADFDHAGIDAAEDFKTNLDLKQKIDDMSRLYVRYRLE